MMQKNYLEKFAELKWLIHSKQGLRQNTQKYNGIARTRFLTSMKKPRAASPVGSCTAAVVSPLWVDLMFTMCNQRKGKKNIF